MNILLSQLGAIFETMSAHENTRNLSRVASIKPFNGKQNQPIDAWLGLMGKDHSYEVASFT
ncbi:hypothetical protein SAMN05216167_13032 [Spirosoma endophyticum]|uniref:Uncharacterized protein n=1 Tax=Spirosoma endophyticum TaxID=662367 RepID=A0A1I2G786_9BACT|nr:hypothetical protein SAMN05216167_13032 [Spirosoma endophyticum]